MKRQDAGKDGGQEEKETTEDMMVGLHCPLNGHEFEQTPGDSEEQGSLACCSPWDYKEPDRIEQLNNNNNILYSQIRRLNIVKMPMILNFTQYNPIQIYYNPN